MNRFILLCAISVPFFLAGCGGTPTDQKKPKAAAESAPKKSKGTIGFSALTLTNPFFKVIADNMKAEAEKWTKVGREANIKID